eukprot:14234-Eustigmatos_ZCMA.PRE.1
MSVYVCTRVYMSMWRCCHHPRICAASGVTGAHFSHGYVHPRLRRKRLTGCILPTSHTHTMNGQAREDAEAEVRVEVLNTGRTTQ